MNILFVHNSFPAQFRHVAGYLAAQPGNKVCAIGAIGASQVVGVTLHEYALKLPLRLGCHSFARRFEVECRRAEQVLYTATSLSQKGFKPHLIVAHCGWGEGLILREAFPNARLVMYCEYYYNAEGQDVDFDPEFPSTGVDGRVNLKLKNASSLLSLIDCDAAVTPTRWQRSTFPVDLQSKVEVIHEGVDVALVVPNARASFVLPSGKRLTRDDEVVTFVARNLEPLRGYHSFIRSLPAVLRDRPNAQVLIVGGDGVSYGAHPPQGTTWKQKYLKEVSGHIDTRRVHFLDTVPYSTYLKILQISTVHVYLTYPFVLSWSMIEAMSAECCVIGSATGPVQEVLDGTNGILVPFFDHEMLGRQIVQVLSKPRAYDGLRRAARATAVERFSTHQCVPQMVDFLCN
jgi:glycosyltransferase involved in cell wall biosynthesis